MPSAAGLLKGTGALLIVHAAYSCLHYRSILMDLDLLDAEGSSASSDTTASLMIPPLDVYIELGLALGLLLLGELMAMGPLQSVDVFAGDEGATVTSSKKKPLVAPPHVTRDFDIYSNRSRMLLHRAAKTR